MPMNCSSADPAVVKNPEKRYFQRSNAHNYNDSVLYVTMGILQVL